MRKKDELTKEHTCMQHAHPEEMVFVLLSRDDASPVAIRAWVTERIRLGKNAMGDEQIVEAIACAQTMEEEGRKWVDHQALTRPTSQVECTICQGLGSIEITGQRCRTCGGSGWVVP